MRDWARTAVLCLVFLMSANSAAQGQVPMAIDLSTAGQEATAQKSPIVLFFSIEECEYCDAVRTESLDHLSTDSGYAGRLLLREIRLDSAMTMVGFDGLQTTHTAFADRRGIGLVPTVQFTDGSGTTLEDDIEGLGTIEFYGAYLEHGIEKALSTLRQRN